MERMLVEAVATPRKNAAGRWLGILAKPGVGSSGTYTAEVLRETGPAALPAGMKAFVNHDASRNPKDMIGFYPDGAVWSEEHQALIGELEVFPHWTEFVDAVAPHTGLSMYAMGEVDEDGMVTELSPSRVNGVDLVSYPGLEGSGLISQLYESARAFDPSGRAADRAAEGKKDQVDEALKQEIVSLLESVLTAKIAELHEALKPVAPVIEDGATPEQMAAAAVEHYASAVAVLDSAELLPSQRSAILEAAKNGTDVAPLVEAAKAVLAEARTHLGAPMDAAGRKYGHVLEEGASPEDWDIKGLEV